MGLGRAHSLERRKRQRLEDCVGAFVAHLEVLALAMKERREKLERHWRELEEQQRRRYEEEQRRQEEMERAKRFEEELRRWRLARDVREYVGEVRALIRAQFGDFQGPARLGERLAWAESFAEGVDPLPRIRQSLPVLSINS